MTMCKYSRIVLLSFHQPAFHTPVVTYFTKNTVDQRSTKQGVYPFRVYFLNDMLYILTIIMVLCTSNAIKTCFFSFFELKKIKIKKKEEI